MGVYVFWIIPVHVFRSHLVVRKAFMVLLLLAFPSAALRKGTRKVLTSKTKFIDDCYSPLDHKPLLQFTECTEDMDVLTKKLMLNGTCECLGEDIASRNNCCSSALVMCEAAAAAELQQKYSKNMVMVSNNTGQYYRSLSGNMKPFRNNMSGRIFLNHPGVFFTDWRPLPDLEQAMFSYEKMSEIASIQEIGRSVCNRKIYAFRFTGPDYVPGNLKILMTFQIQGRDWITGLSGIYIIDQIIKTLQKTPNWLSRSEIVLVPVANPDGFNFTGVSNRLWCKNRHDSTICKGVHLNSNFPFDWNGPYSTSTEECDDFYVGPTPSSEPETQAIMGLINESSLKAHIDFQAYGEVIVGSFSEKVSVSGGNAYVKRLMYLMAQAISAQSGKNYTTAQGNVSAAIKNAASGTAVDYSQSLDAWGLIVKLSPKELLDGGYFLGSRRIYEVVQDAWAGALAAIDFLLEISA